MPVSASYINLATPGFIASTGDPLMAVIVQSIFSHTPSTDREWNELLYDTDVAALWDMVIRDLDHIIADATKIHDAIVAAKPATVLAAAI